MSYSLAELCICAGAEAFRHDGEKMATLIGVVPRLAGGLAKLTFNPGLMMTEGEAYLVSEPVPLGPRGDYQPKIEGLMTYERVFDIVYRGDRHCFVGPVQVDRYGQMNISVIGGTYEQPKVALLGARGFPGNTINNINSMFVPKHNTKAFVDGEVDMVSSVGYNPTRWPDGKKPPYLELRHIITDLCVMDFGGADNAIRVISLHPGVSFDEVQDNTGFPLEKIDGLGDTPAPTEDQLELIRKLDPHNLRATVFEGNPPGDRRA
ncbi:CoA-transferase subunit beta [Emcibacter nanhaiensis]|uniref:Ketoacid CoA transferase n=1 Tax=Emcibacter nanhaiensis TaxID=1505037 RepID=A0A501PKU6_9PROT|nr:CoA-transferase [Emcibacter nanhaiensis]TPD60712.1 ketoacid CoA transferase [Emcibacter nanhaiensis]